VTGYIIRRILITIPMLLILSVLVFSLIQLAPGDPTVFFIPSNYSDAPIDIEAFREKLRHELGLDRPVYVQYWSWLSRTAQGDLGYAFTYRVPVTDLIIPRIGPTVALQCGALILAVVVAVPIGILSARKQYSLADHVVTFFAFLGISLPSFWMALLLMLFFAVRLGWLPSGGAGLDKPPPERIVYFILPTVVLATEYMAWYARFMRSSTLEVLRADYITTARAKGLTDRVVLFRHVLKNALLPLITVVGLSLPRLVGGAIIVESIFAWPGLGRLAYDAVLRRDQPVIMALTLLTSAVIAVSNLVVDVAYVLVDPRISYSGAKHE
jgi:peptide/nickel transport system permease protein